jgi:hypothetical protein
MKRKHPWKALSLSGPVQAFMSCCVRAFHLVEKALQMTARTEIDIQPSSMTVREPPTRAATGPSFVAPAVDFTGHGTILLVEDDESVRSLIARGLRSRGFDVIEESNGLEALGALEQKNGAVDLVVSDVIMPEMDGPTLLKSPSFQVHGHLDAPGGVEPDLVAQRAY